MLPITTIISRVRENINDTTKTGYTEKEIIASINSAMRFLRRTIKTYRPMMLADVCEGTLAFDKDSQMFEDKVTLEKLPTAFLDIRINNVRIEAVNIAFIRDINARGVPNRYYQIGMGTIKFYPMPNKEVNYRILYVPDFIELKKDDTTPIPNDFDDFIIEYTVLRLAMGDEFNMSQEAELMSNIHEQIKQNLLCGSNESNYINGYFDCVVRGW